MSKITITPNNDFKSSIGDMANLAILIARTTKKKVSIEFFGSCIIVNSKTTYDSVLDDFMIISRCKGQEEKINKK